MATKKKPSSKDAAAYTATLHGAESYTASDIKFRRGKPVPVSRELGESLPRRKFSIVPIVSEEAEEVLS